MSNQVRVITGQDGAVIQQNPNKPDKFFIQVEDAEGISIKNGFLQGAKKAALTLDVSLKEAATKLFTAGKILTGKIVVKETRTIQWPDHKVCINPTTNAPALRGGLPYYRSAKFTENLSEMDELLSNEPVAAPVFTGEPILHRI